MSLVIRLLSVAILVLSFYKECIGQDKYFKESINDFIQNTEEIINELNKVHAIKKDSIHSLKIDSLTFEKLHELSSLMNLQINNFVNYQIEISNRNDQNKLRLIIENHKENDELLVEKLIQWKLEKVEVNQEELLLDLYDLEKDFKELLELIKKVLDNSDDIISIYTADELIIILKENITDVKSKLQNYFDSLD